MSLRPHVVATAAVVAAALPSSAGAAATTVTGTTCKNKGTVESGHVLDIARIPRDDQGAPKLDEGGLDTLKRRVYYLAERKSSVMMQKSVFTLDAGTVFTLGCMGTSKAEGAIHPRIEILAGTARVKAQDKRTVALSAYEGMFDNYAEASMTMRVARVPKGDPTLREILDNGPSILRFGTTRGGRTAGSGYVNFTPYVGPRPGTCRQGRSARLTSTGRTSDGSLAGTASFTGLSPSSPR